MNLNAKTPYILCKEFHELLKESDYAFVINIGSVMSYSAYETQGIYAASKHALRGFTKAYAKEVFKDDIRVHLINPGGVLTEMVKETRPDLDTSILSLPDEIASWIDFIISNRNRSCVDEINIRRFTKIPWA